MNKVPGQFIQDTIPKSSDNDCAKCMMLEEENKRLKKLMQGWDKTEAEIRIEAIENFMRQVILNQLYGKDALITLYRNHVKELNNDK